MAADVSNDDEAFIAQDYVCTLDDHSINKATVMLNEIPCDRMSAVQSLKDWAHRNKDWLTCPTDTRFFLAFLRISKFSQLTARERIVNFLGSFNESVSYLNGHDPADPLFLDILRKSKVYTPLPNRDREGRTVILGNYENFDASGNSYSYPDFQRSILGICHSLVFCDEQFQVHGVNFLMDYGSITMKHLRFGGSENMRNRVQHFEKALPVSIKQFHNYNTGPIFNVLLHILRPALPEKMRVRVFMHGHSMVSVYKHIDISLLPTEYLPDDYEGKSAGTLDEITEHNIRELLLNPGRRAFIKDLWSGRYGVDASRKPQNEMMESGSYRKMNT